MKFELFDHFNRSDKEGWRFDESSFTYLNRAHDAFIEERRQQLEGWFARYPGSEKADLRSRFCSEKDYEQHYPAFSELAAHELLECLGCCLIPHPDQVTAKGKPDFLVKEPDGGDFILEVVTPTGVKTEAARNILTSFYQGINGHLRDSGYQIEVWEDRLPSRSPIVRKAVDFLQQKISETNNEEIVEQYKQTNGNQVPEHSYDDGIIKVKFRLIPECCLPEPVGPFRPIETVIRRIDIVNYDTIRNKLKGKAGAYGEVKLPYVVAANVLDWSCQEDVVKLALFGPEWKAGLWYQKDQGLNKRVSAVLAFIGLQPLNVVRAQCRLWLNPWADRPYEGVLLQLPHAFAERKHRGGEISWRDGLAPSSFYGVT